MSIIKNSFLEKYRPKTRKEIVGNKINKERIFSKIDNGIFPNMLLAGDPGTGKTSTIKVCINDLNKKLSGSLINNVDVITINCSDKTGVDYVRKEIISVAETKPLGKIRLFVLEECEELSTNAFNALRKVFEAPYDKTNKFALLCNNYHKVMPAIRDRCRVFIYVPIQPEEMIPRLKEIANKEKILIDDKLIEKLAEYSNGSMRFPLIRLEEFKALNREINENDIQLIDDLEIIKTIFLLLKQKKINEADKKTMELYQKGNNFFSIMKSYHDFTMMSLEKSVDNIISKEKVLISIANSEKNVREGCNEFIQLSSLLAEISIILNKK